MCYSPSAAIHYYTFESLDSWVSDLVNFVYNLVAGNFDVTCGLSEYLSQPRPTPLLNEEKGQVEDFLWTGKFEPYDNESMEGAVERVHNVYKFWSEITCKDIWSFPNSMNEEPQIKNWASLESASGRTESLSQDGSEAGALGEEEEEAEEEDKTPVKKEKEQPASPPRTRGGAKTPSGKTSPTKASVGGKTPRGRGAGGKDTVHGGIAGLVEAGLAAEMAKGAAGTSSSPSKKTPKSAGKKRSGEEPVPETPASKKKGRK